MNQAIDCALDGVRLSSIDGSICILDICEDAPQMKSIVLPLGNGSQRILRQERESLSVQVFLSIQEPEPLRRQQVYQALLSWAEQGGELVLSTRPDQRLQVACTAHPALHADDWTETLRLVFTTAAAPFWEDTQATTVTLPEAAALTMPGNASAAPVSVMLINQGEEDITSLTLRCGSTQMTFDGITLPARSAFSLTNSNGVLSATIAGASVLQYRTAASDDLLLAPCGQSCPVSVIVDQPYNAAFSARGRYL